MKHRQRPSPCRVSSLYSAGSVINVRSIRSGRLFNEGTQLWLRNISGHCDGNEASSDSGACPIGTLCPGRYLYEVLPFLRERVQRELAHRDSMQGIEEIER
jgi:hypothetical protein